MRWKGFSVRARTARSHKSSRVGKDTIFIQKHRRLREIQVTEENECGGSGGLDGRLADRSYVYPAQRCIDQECGGLAVASTAGSSSSSSSSSSSAGHYK
ncbi:hypothetical protein E2C01_082499 [Portunus trituberculatus]|uniref:Uncharacterized protein n=1 Tax=Portunus trituberculatus TaxID=210409 RepID=A0A5B7IZA8_PORTR|nr:hypothetical protein [Portunus trituberculatus]